MTVQVITTAFSASKTKLAAALNADAKSVMFFDPSIFAGSRGHFTGADIPVNDNFVAVLDPATRRRFATVARLKDGFKVL